MDVYGGGYSSRPPQVDFSWLSDGWNLFKQQSGTWIVAALLAGVIDLAVSGVLDSVFGDRHGSRSGSMRDLAWYLPHSFGEAFSDFVDHLVSSVLFAGLFRMALRQIRGEKLSPFDFLAIGDVFVPLVGAAAIAWCCTAAGYLICILPGIILGALFMFVPLYIVAERAGPVEAVSRSFNALKGQWLMATLFYFLSVLGIVASLCLCGVGELAVIPQVVLAIAVGFTRFGGGGSPSALPPGAPRHPGVAPAFPIEPPVPGQLQDGTFPPQGPSSAGMLSPQGQPSAGMLPPQGPPSSGWGPPQGPPSAGMLPPQGSAESGPQMPSQEHGTSTARIPRESLRSAQNTAGRDDSRKNR